VSYSWSSGANENVERRIPADRPVWIISDLHLGDGDRNDTFMGKDRALLALLEEVRAARGRLVIAGDAIDILQAGDLTRVIKAHGKLLQTLSSMAAAHDVIYLCGNHDDDMRVYRDLLRFEVCNRLWIGDEIVVQHGHEFDEWIGPQMQTASFLTRMHHGIERACNVWIRLPLADFYNWGNRLAFWLFHKYWWYLHLRNALFTKLGFLGAVRHSEWVIDYWVRNEAGDPMTMTMPAVGYAKKVGAKFVVCGHAHMPGNVDVRGVRYVNTGSWTFGWAQYAHWDGKDFAVKDWLSGRTYGDELYRPLVDGDLDHVTFPRWWRNQYLGWFRFRSGELRKFRRVPA
jgi:UDP-2,3-diacylglucosamine pyrophosphatase LpxH